MNYGMLISKHHVSLIQLLIKIAYASTEKHYLMSTIGQIRLVANI